MARKKAPPPTSYQIPESQLLSNLLRYPKDGARPSHGPVVRSQNGLWARLMTKIRSSRLTQATCAAFRGQTHCPPTQSTATCIGRKVAGTRTSTACWARSRRPKLMNWTYSSWHISLPFVKQPPNNATSCASKLRTWKHTGRTCGTEPHEVFAH